jgi:hypothetical protein
MGSAGFGGGPITQHGPVGPIRNAVVQYLIAACTCGLGAVYLTYTFANELNQFRQKNDVSFIMLLLIIGWLSIPEKVIEAKRMAGIPNPSASNVILYLFFWPYFLTLDLNEIYTAAGAQS